MTGDERPPGRIAFSSYVSDPTSEYGRSVNYVPTPRAKPPTLILRPAPGGFQAVCDPLIRTAADLGVWQADPFNWGEAASALIDPLRVGREKLATARGSDGWWARGKAEAFEDRADRLG